MYDVNYVDLYEEVMSNGNGTSQYDYLRIKIEAMDTTKYSPDTENPSNEPLVCIPIPEFRQRIDVFESSVGLGRCDEHLYDKVCIASGTNGESMKIHTKSQCPAGMTEQNKQLSEKKQNECETYMHYRKLV